MFHTLYIKTSPTGKIEIWKLGDKEYIASGYLNNNKDNHPLIECLKKYIKLK